MTPSPGRSPSRPLRARLAGRLSPGLLLWLAACPGPAAPQGTPVAAARPAETAAPTSAAAPQGAPGAPRGEVPGPRLDWRQPADGAVVEGELVLVAGRVASPRPPLAVELDGRSLPLVPAGEGAWTFEAWLPLESEEPSLTLVARDARGELRQVRRVRRAAPPPAEGPRLPPGVVREGEGFRCVRDGSPLVYVPPARFRAGRDDPQRPEEGPRHRVRLRRGFFLGQHEVTRARLERWAREEGRAAPSWPEAGGDPADPGLPALGLTWEEALHYALWAGGRLPTEAEWEYAAGLGQRAYPWGDGPLPDGSWPLPAGGPSPVGSFPSGASPFGCLDMAGNAAEWVLDRWGPYPEGEQTDPRGEDQPGELRVQRGGSWLDTPEACRVTARRGVEPQERGPAGLRLCFPEP